MALRSAAGMVGNATVTMLRSRMVMKLPRWTARMRARRREGCMEETGEGKDHSNYRLTVGQLKTTHSRYHPASAATGAAALAKGVTPIAA
ncbi:hypothetical protein G6F31_021561 [Rhizopus arrhizus]|nr:hypothetical protein G6F31_021561 [Rhizopus arrhizus]